MWSYNKSRQNTLFESGMELFHATDREGKEGIAESGFGVSHLPDSHCKSWFSTVKKEASATASRRSEWFVIVDMPNDVAERHRDPEVEYLYEIPWDVVNQYRPFRFEQTNPID